jgi:hypothetical protein
MAENPADIKPNDYLAALARKVSRLKGVPDNTLHADEIRKILGNPVELAKFINGKPHLQEQLASLTNFMPSQWLLAQEIPAIRQRRLLLTQSDDQFNPGDDPYKWARLKKLQGICFSGGGIRSATLNLGILQGLAGLPHKDDEPGMLSRFDYLSSVSGGGYIHEWFAAWVKRETLPEVEKKLKPLPNSGQPCHPEAIRWLRKYSNYLTPQKGLLTGDTWVAVAIWFRNTFLNQVILVSILFLLLHLPNLLTPYLIQESEVGFVPAAIILFLLALASITYTLWHEYDRITGGPPAPSERGFARKGFLDRGNETTIQFAVILPLLMAGVFYLNHVVNHGVSKWDVAGVFLSQWVLVASLAFAGACLDVYKMARGLTVKPSGWERVRYEIRIILVAIGGVVLCNAAVAAAGGTLLFLGVNWLMHVHLPASVFAAIGRPDPWKFQITFGPAMLLAVSFMSLVLGAGLIGRDFRDWLREWLGRVRAWALLFGILWTGYFGIALLGPYLFSTQASSLVKGVKWTAVVTWVLTTAGAVLAGQSSKTGGDKDSEKTAGTLALLTTFGPPIFILGLLLLISRFAAMCGTSASDGWRFWVPLAAPLFIFVLFGFRVDINDFSMNPFYRNRLTRCYLGATNDQRDPNPLTGFDDRDTAGMQMSQLLPPGISSSGSSSATGAAGGVAGTQTSADAQKVKKGYLGPYPIICTTINLTFGQDLAWQERKAASFTFTPLYCGYHVGWTAGTGKHHLSYNGFVPTDLYAVPNGGINIATAVAISGAAASPNMGYHSNPSIAFLLTMFNVRLGWWLFNPRRSKFAGKAVGPSDELPEWPSPRFAPFELSKELLGMANDESKYVYLSDGGHFDNMGLYELVRRRCYRIVICDAEQDEGHMFAGIASAIRKCRIDFGVEITLDLEALRPNKKTGRCKVHHVRGTIRYPETPAAELGEILYIKSSLTGTIKREKQDELPCEPIDILNYRYEHSTFPHDTTANQWFTESQFESYRRLGQHMVEEVALSGGWEKF